MSQKRTTIGLFGYGVVGEAFAKKCQGKSNLRIKTICTRRQRENSGGEEWVFSTTPSEILDEPEIDIIVELIDDPIVAYNIASAAIRKRKPLITANKKMLAENLGQLLELQKWFGTPIFCEAAVAAGIPIIESLRGHYEREDIQELKGILNGSCNYILDRVDHGMKYNYALKEAQEAGFAESDPTLDVDGWDTRYKTTLLAYHGFGELLDPLRVFTRGIAQVKPEDVEYARSKGKNLKLLAQVRRVSDSVVAWCAPTLINGRFSGVEKEYNAIELTTRSTGHHFLMGKGAGGDATALSVFADLRRAIAELSKPQELKICWKSKTKADATVQVILRQPRVSTSQYWEQDRVEEESVIGEWKYQRVSCSLKELDAWNPGNEEGEFLMFLG